MATLPTKISDLPSVNAIASSDSFVILANTGVKLATLDVTKREGSQSSYSNIAFTANTYTLSNTEARSSILFVTSNTGANVILTVPTRGRWDVCNQTNNTLTVTTANGTGINVATTVNYSLIADGNNVIQLT